MSLRKRGDIRQDERSELAQVGRVHQPIVDHLEGDARFNERLIPAQRVVLDLGAAKPCRLLGIDQADPRERVFVAQVFLPLGVAAVEVFDWFEPALVVQHTGELGEPWTQVVGHPLGNPQPYLRFALDAILPAIRLFHADAEDADDGFAAHGGAEFLPVLAVGPRRGQAAACLPVGDEHGGKFADALHVQVTGGSAAGIGDDAGVRV